MIRRSTFALFVLILAGSCKTSYPDPRQDLVTSFPQTSGYVFETRDDDAATVTTLTNPAVRGGIRIDRTTANVPLRYTRIRDKKTGVTTTYRSEILRSGSSARLVVTDVTNNHVLDDLVFPDFSPAEPRFPSLEACIADFNCLNKGRLECEANRTCKPQFAALTCCLTDGTCFSVHMIYPPTSIRCQLRDLVPADLELVLAP
ncbi:MAG TPA: hypothetical protein VE974_21250 [Thermoanaerobaculia bacterium]|nr:hypothetical protein [Thermoanaerobaculia bacterium]